MRERRTAVQGLEPRVGAQARRPCAWIKHDSGRVHPSGLGTGGGVEGAGHRAFPAAPPRIERGPPQPKEAGVGLLLPGVSRLPFTPLPRTFAYTLGTMGRLLEV